jgi:hypothetical protein
VRDRVFIRFSGRCHICTRKIAIGESWVCDHAHAIINNGSNCETNLRVLCDWCDKKVKTPADMKEKAKVARTRKKHLGIKKRGRTIAGRKFDGTAVPSRNRNES